MINIALGTMSKSQELKIFEHLQSGKSLTPIDALNLYGCFRLAARIEGLRKQGFNILSEDEFKNGKRYSRYFMAGGMGEGVRQNEQKRSAGYELFRSLNVDGRDIFLS